VCDDSLGHGPYKIACTMTKSEGCRLRFDFTGTDPQSPGSINFFLNEDMFRMFCGAYMIMVRRPRWWTVHARSILRDTMTSPFPFQVEHIIRLHA
jgi:hypothetical protein